MMKRFDHVMPVLFAVVLTSLDNIQEHLENRSTRSVKTM